MTEFSRRIFLGFAAASGIAGTVTTVSAAEANPTWDAETDILIAGGGAAGCMAAVEAAKAGSKVMLVHATPVLGGSSAISSGWIRCSGTRWHEARKVKDSPEAFKADILAYGKGCRLEAKADVIARESAAFVNYLMDIGVTFTDEEDRANGGEALRIVKTQGGGGALMRQLSDVVAKTPGVTIRKQTEIEEIITNADRTDLNFAWKLH